MKKRFTILIAAAVMLLAIMLQPTRLWGQERGTYTKTEGFETQSTGSNYQGTVNITTDKSDCGISWQIFYGCVSTYSAITNQSAAMRLYKGNNNYGYLKTTTPVYGLSNVACKAKASTSNSAKIKINVDYSINGSDWVNIETNKELSTSSKSYDWDIPSGGKYFRISISSASTKPTSGNAQLTIDDVVFTYTGYTVTYDANGGSGTMTDANSPYGAGATVITLENTFTAPSSASFNGWNTASGGDGTSYDEGDEFTINANTTLYAQWLSAGNYITVSPTSVTPTCAAQNVVFNVDTDQSLTASSVQFYTAASGGTETSKPDWIGTIAYDGSSSPKTLTVPVTENTGVARHAYFTLKNGSIESSRVTINQAAITVATPEFDEDEGTYFEDLLVDITCDTDGATIYYTTDGSTPAANNGTEYDGNGVSIEEGETTLKAIAIKNNVSSPVASATYTVMYPLTTMEAIFEASASAGSYYVTFNNWVVTGVNGNQVFVTDGTKGFIIYKSGHDFSVGNIISGTTTNATALTRFKGSAEFTALTSSTSDLTVTTGGTVTPQVVTIGDLSGVNTGSVITLNGLTYNSTDGVLSDGDHTITPYTSLYTGTFTNGTIYNITGVYQQYGDDEPHNILPRSSADIVEVHDPAITTSPATSLSVPDYIKGTPESGIDTEILTVNGTYLTADVTVALENGASSDFEMSTDLETWGHSITLNQSNGSVTNAEIAVRLKVGESVADYSDRIVLSSTNATTKYVNVTGSVTYAHVTYNGNGDGVSYVPEDDNDYGYEEEVTVLGEGSMIRTGYEFIGWNTESDGTGDDYEEDGTFNITEDVTLFAQWTAKSYNITADPAITHGSISFTVGGEAATTAQTGQTVTIVSTPDSGYGLSSVSVNSGAVTVTNNTFEMPASDVIVSATFVPTVTDIITASTLNISGNSYTTWTGKTFSSEAVYAGCSYPTSKIQLKSKDNVSGIVTTATGGKIKKIKVIWDSGSGTLDVYGRNSAYSAATNLYNTSSDGTKLGSINYTNSSSGAELEINNDTVTYIGLRSNSGTIYISQIEITWAAPTHALAYDKNDSEASGTMSDPNSPYIYNASVTVLAKANTITAPSGKMFSKWNAKSDGTGKDYAPGDTLKMPKHDKTLYAIWEDECNETATMAATLGAKEYVNNAGELSFKINLSSKVTALSSCAEITEYGFVYSINGTTPTVGGANCTKIVKGTEYTTANTVFEHELTGATLGATYKICSYATNLAGTAYGTMATVEIDADYPSYTISYSTNGTAEGSTTKIYQGNAISDLIEPTPANVPAGYSFRGWYGDDYALNNSAPTFVKNGDAISGNLALKAVFAIGTTAPEDVEHNMIFTEMAIASGSGYHTGTSAENNIDVSFTDCLRSGGYIQMKATSGEIHNTKAIGNYITKIEIDANKNASNVTVFEGSNSSSITTSITKKDDVYTFSGNTQFFKVGNNGTYTVVKIKVYYNQTEDVTTYSNYCTSVTDITENEYIDNEGKLTDDITISSGALSIESPITIPSGKTLTVEGTGVLVNTDPAYLVIEDGGQLITKSSGVNATVKKNIEQAADWGTLYTYMSDQWYFVASPVNGAAFPTGSINDQDIYKLDWANNKWLNLQHSDNSSLLEAGFQRGTGYLYASKEGNIISVAGVIQPLSNDNTATVTLANDGWNLIGNPLTCKVTVDCAFSELVNASAVTNKEANSVINPCQGIAVYGNAGTEVTFTKAATQDAVAPSNNNSLQMTLAKTITSRGDVSTKVVDNAVVSFKESKCMPKFNMIGSNTKLFIPQDDEEYSIVFSDRQGDVPLYFKANETGTYTISFAGDEMSLNGIYLIDILAEEEIDLSVNPSYTFIGSPADRMARFKIVFRNTGGDGTSDIFAYQNGNDIVITGEGELQIFDVMGRMVSKQRVNGVETVNVKSQGVYIFRLNDKTQKIVVR